MKGSHSSSDTLKKQNQNISSNNIALKNEFTSKIDVSSQTEDEKFRAKKTMTMDDNDVKINKTNDAANDNNNDANNRNTNKDSKNGNEKERVIIPLLEQAITNASSSIKHMMEILLS